MRLKVIIPNVGMKPETLRAREVMLKQYAMPDTVISADCIDRGPESIESNYDEVLASVYILESIKKAEADGFDVVIIYCGSDPAIEAARELVNIPVIGPGRISMMMAQELAYKFSIITAVESSISRDEEHFRKMGFDPTRLVSVRSLDIPVSRIRNDMEYTYQAIIKAGRKAIEEDGAHGLVLKCLGTAGLGRRVQEELGVPVIDPAFLAVKYAELIAGLGLVYSKKSYTKPPEKVRL